MRTPLTVVVFPAHSRTWDHAGALARILNLRATMSGTYRGLVTPGMRLVDLAYFVASFIPVLPKGTVMKTIVFVLLGVLVFTGTAHAQQTYDDRHRISVTGEALVNVAPDRVIVTFGVDTRDMVLDTAKRQNDAIVKRALAAIKAMGIGDRDIQTDRLSIEQRFESPGGREVFAGFTIRNMFVVSLGDPAKVDALITAALDSGVNYLLNVEFRTTELKKYREQARELATRAAREKAEKMASALGERVGQALQIDEAGQNSGVSYYSSWSSGWGAGNRGNAGASQNTVGISGGETVDTVALGKVGVRASVRVVFELIRR